MNIKYIKHLASGRIISYDDDANEMDKPGLLFYKDEITISDELEVLLDEILWVEKDNPSHRKFDDQYTWVSGEQVISALKKWDIYGMVWNISPNKLPRLESVAKINEEGRFELLWNT